MFINDFLKHMVIDNNLSTLMYADDTNFSLPLTQTLTEAAVTKSIIEYLKWWIN